MCIKGDKNVNGQFPLKIVELNKCCIYLTSLQKFINITKSKTHKNK